MVIEVPVLPIATRISFAVQLESQNEAFHRHLHHSARCNSRSLHQCLQRATVPSPNVCADSKAVKRTYIGKDNYVLVEQLACGAKDLRSASSSPARLPSRQDPKRVCRAECAYEYAGVCPNPKSIQGKFLSFYLW
ncbi:hypothetical protein BD410DRAFT_260726 [Rickenella mellea]|uniref:Uncharacterized protein n=1 Tax=Rickenella mellea TaxID=50990 RepID=A0A4Y7Q5F1_9AGAM|nr:hypothetical protein BD410DRAFT_260726 [Rickenella mellea]